MEELGTLQEYIAYPADDLELAPLHLNNAEAAALPLCGLTAYRATFTKGGVAPGQNVLVTGIGGGVALHSMQFAAARGATVFVTSSSPEKLRKAKELGASAGVNYKDSDWERQLAKLLPKNRPYLDAVIDGAGGDIVNRTSGLLKHGGIIVSYGLTLGPQAPFSIKALLKNIEVCSEQPLHDITASSLTRYRISLNLSQNNGDQLSQMRGSTMGSRKEFAEMVSRAQTLRHSCP